MVAVELKNVSKDYGRFKAVRQVDLKVEKNDIYGLIGRNGAGKTTFMKIISNLASPSSGSYKIFGYEKNENYKARTRGSAALARPWAAISAMVPVSTQNRTVSSAPVPGRSSPAASGWMMTGSAMTQYPACATVE